MTRLRGAGRGTPSLARPGPGSAVPLHSETLEPHFGLRTLELRAVGSGDEGRPYLRFVLGFSGQSRATVVWTLLVNHTPRCSYPRITCFFNCRIFKFRTFAAAGSVNKGSGPNTFFHSSSQGSRY